MTITNPTRGMNTTSDLVTGIPLNMDEAIYMVSYNDSPMINGIDSDGYQILPQLGLDAISFSWLDEERLTPEDQLAEALDNSETAVDVDIGAKFQVGDLFRVVGSAEIFRVTSIATNTLTVVRGYGTSAATTHADNAKVIILGTLLVEGSDPGTARSADRTSRSNNSQIHGPDAVNMSRTEMGRRKFGVASEWSHQLFNRMVEQIQRREFNLLYGIAMNAGDLGAGLRMSGGFDHFITTNEDSSTTALSVTAIESLQQLAYLKGGIPDMLTANPIQIKPLNELTDTGRVRTTLPDPYRGRTSVMEVITEFGECLIVRNRFCVTNNAFMWTRTQATRRVFDAMRYEQLSKTGDSEKGQLVAEEGLEFKGEQHAGKFSALT